jgi:hypothetical protein
MVNCIAVLRTVATVAVVTCVAHGTFAQTPPASATVASPRTGSVKIEIVPALIVLNARGASLQSDTLTLMGVGANSITFADRPVRAAGHLLTKHLLEEWTPGGSFAKDPPNAAVSVMSKDGSSVQDAVLELRSPKLDGDTLTFNVRVLEGSLPGADGPASVFIDIIGLPFTPLSFAGVARRTARRAYWYGAATHPPYPYPPPAYYPPPGYYAPPDYYPYGYPPP